MILLSGNLQQHDNMWWLCLFPIIICQEVEQEVSPCIQKGQACGMLSLCDHTLLRANLNLRERPIVLPDWVLPFKDPSFQYQEHWGLTFQPMNFVQGTHSRDSHPYLKEMSLFLFFLCEIWFLLPCCVAVSSLC